MKGVGAEHQMLMSATSICECEHSHPYVSLISARQGRATPFKKRKSPLLEEEKRAKPRKSHLDPDFLYHEFANLRTFFLKKEDNPLNLV